MRTERTKRYSIAALHDRHPLFGNRPGALLNTEPRQAWIWTSTIYTLTAFILMTTTLMAFIESGRERLAWIGFSVFGWAYLLLLGFELTHVLQKPRLLTTWVLVEGIADEHDRAKRRATEIEHLYGPYG